MNKRIFINLPVTNLAQSIAFYEAIGLKNNPKFTDETAACMVYSEEINIMLLNHDKFSQFTDKPISDTMHSIAVINSLAVDGPEAVHAMMDKALAAGGREPVEGKDYGFMLHRSFLDPDGHAWEVFYMDESKFPQ